MENVPRVPSLQVLGYTCQRIDVTASEFGLRQRRLRHFQFGSRHALMFVLPRGVTPVEPVEQAAMASEGKRRKRRGWAEFCALQGVPPLALPGMRLADRYKAVGNAVPLPVARAFAPPSVSPRATPSIAE
jgi:DNA (cytosine-5)-methyltransferase 1